jgi:hypothetical protein
VKKEKCLKAGKMYIKNNSTYFNLNKMDFCTAVYSSFVPLDKGMFSNCFRVRSDN